MSETKVQSFDGEIKKCPSCGAVLPSMAAKYPECGFELRNTEASNSVKDFQRKYTSSTDTKYHGKAKFLRLLFATELFIIFITQFIYPNFLLNYY